MSSPREINYTAQRVFRALETVVLCPSSAPEVAEAIGIHPRTARRILGTLHAEQYLDYVVEGRTRHYVPTPRLLAVAAQLAPRLPLAEHGRRTTATAHQALGLTATLAIPCYADILIVAASGAGLRRWALLPADAHAAGHALLAHREAWRASHSPQLLCEEEAAGIRERGYADVASEDARRGSLAVVVPADEQPPIAALSIDGASEELRERTDQLVDHLNAAARGLAADLR